MIFLYVRHGEPIYNPDSLTPRGEEQAKALAKRMAVFGVDRVFSSSSNRAIQTAKPTCELLNKEMEILDFANEAYAFRDFSIEIEGGRTWTFQDADMELTFADNEIVSMGHNWHNHPDMTRFKKGLDRVYNETFNLFKSLGYEHIKGTSKYKVIRSNNERVAFFAHQGFGVAFLSAVLNIPYPVVSNHFELGHTGVTVINFDELGEYAIPKIMTLSSDGHLYKEGLPTIYF